DHNRRLTGTPLQDLSGLCSKLRHTVLIRRPLSELRKELPPLTRKAVLLRHDDYDGDVTGIDSCLDDVVVLGLKSNPRLKAWFISKEEKIRRLLKQLSDRALPRQDRQHLQETLKTLLTIARQRTGACKHDAVLSYLMHCRQKTVVF